MFRPPGMDDRFEATLAPLGERLRLAENPAGPLPLVAEDKDTLLQQAREVLEYRPDALEWNRESF